VETAISEKRISRRSTISWILYDLANTAYSMNVVSLYFGTWITINLMQNDALFPLANSVSMILVALTMPVLGEWSDIKSKKMMALALFTALCIGATALMGILPSVLNISVLVPVIIVIFIIANYSYQGGLVFYNALMPFVSTPKTIGRVSGYGVALGYVGAIIGLLVARIFVDGVFFGISLPFIHAGGTTAAFVPTAVVFFIFAVPIFIFVREPVLTTASQSPWRIQQSYRKIWNTIKDTQKYPGLLRFLVSTLLSEDSIETVIIIMGIYLQKVVGFTLGETQQFLILVIPSAVIGSAICGILVDHYGPKKTLMGVNALWVLCLFVVVLAMSHTVYWILGCVIGALMGSVWTSARPLLVSLVPKEMLGEFFGLYALSGKVAAVIGPIVWSIVIFLFSGFGTVIQYKAAVAALAIVMILGLYVLRLVPDKHKKTAS
jgi:MFS transporter, UMF1 family